MKNERRPSSLSVGIDPLPDDLPEEVVQDAGQQAFTAVLEAPVPLSSDEVVNLIPRYRALCEKYDVRPNSGVLTGLERALQEEGKSAKTSYNFAHCNLGDRGIAPILLALCHDRQRPLKVNLRDCGLHTTGCYIVAGFLRHPTIVQLDMSDNPVSLTAGEMLLAAVEARPSLSPPLDLRLAGTYVTKQGKKPVVGYPCGHRTNLRPRYSFVASSLGRVRSPSPDGSEKSFATNSSSKKSDATAKSESKYSKLRSQLFMMNVEESD
jgi:hypothetical protein